jgi:hypothetical protein
METLPQLQSLPRAERRRFAHICRSGSVCSLLGIRDLRDGLDKNLFYRFGATTWLEDAEWVYTTGMALGLSEWDILRYWTQVREATAGKNALYRRKPTRVKQDNKDRYASGRGCSGNTIRFPRKVRSKACWRRFYALFPHLDPAKQVTV